MMQKHRPPHCAWMWALLSAFTVVVVTAAQQSPSTSGPVASPEDDWEHGRRLLQGVRDDVFSFDDPAFYWLCQFVRRHANGPELRASVSETPIDGALLLERPNAFRGRVVTIEGILRAKRSYEVSNRRDTGLLHQYEVALPGGLMCAVVSPGEEFGGPVGQSIRAKGYFLKTRRFRTAAGHEASGPVLIAPKLRNIGLTVATQRPSEKTSATSWLLGGTAALAIFWLLLRRTQARRGSAAVNSPGAGDGAPPTDRDFDWLLRGESSRGEIARPESSTGEAQPGPSPETETTGRDHSAGRSPKS
jgi:hypothetical protein